MQISAWLTAAFVIALPASIRSADEPAGQRKVATPTIPTAKTLRVAAVQMRSERNLEQNLVKTRQFIAHAAKVADVVVFPECSVTGYFDRDYMRRFSAAQLADAESKVAASCKLHRINAIVGMPVRQDDKLYNSAVVIDRNGNVVERYHKVQLAEAWPIPGDHLSVFRVDGVPCSVIVCHDVRYPELARLPTIAGARVLFFISHESGIKAESKIQPYRAQIQARAAENCIYVVQANAPANHDASGSHGQSRIIAPDGNIVKEAGIFTEETVVSELDLSRAHRRFAERSAKTSPLGDWWQTGAQRVRIIENR